MKQNDYIVEFNNNKFEPYYDKLTKPYYSISFKPWNMFAEKDTDFFKYFRKGMLEKLQQGSIYLIIDWSDEGYSLETFGIANQINYNIDLYNIDPSNVIYLSSNLRDEQNAQTFNYKFHVCSWDHFSYVTHDMTYEIFSPEEQWDRMIEATYKSYEDKKFCSLSRVFREHRCYASFKLSTSKIANQGLISHGIVPKDFNNISFNAKDKVKFQKWRRNLPLVIDRKDFHNNLNWQFVDEAMPIFSKTLFQIANESQVSAENNTAMFITEKTLKSIFFMQPVVVFGQPSVNKELGKIGYNTYEPYFNLDFDDIPEYRKRYNRLLENVTLLIKHINSLDIKEQIAWRFQHRSLLMDNYKTLIESKPYRLEKFINDLPHTYK